mgnify:FL=1
MKTISFDIGIKNMAYCIFDCSNSIDILDWKVLNLNEENTIVKSTCNAALANSKIAGKVCGKTAKYQRNDNCYCEKHAKASKFLLPTKENQFTQIKKMKVAEVVAWGKQHFIFLENSEKQSKASLLEEVKQYLDKNCLEKITYKKTKNASQVDLVVVGKAMKTLLDEVAVLPDVTHVIIENQISPIANRMKTIQGMLAQYFIMRNENCTIEFISSANKLKQFSDIGNNHTKKPKQSNTTLIQNPDYKAHKKDGIYYCSTIIQRNFERWTDTLLTDKKDDLADAFLQGLWYFKHRNIITYAEDLKINSV